MNAKQLYVMIGKIDDDLILEAGNMAEKKKKWVVMRLAAVAACICLLLGGGYTCYMDQYTVWNQAATGFAGKAAIPGDGIVKILTKEEGESYYNIASLSETVGDGLKTTGLSFMVVQDTQGKILYDRNLIRYESSDHLKGVNLTLSRVSTEKSIENEEKEKMKNSHIKGYSVVLTEDDLGDGIWLLEARWEKNGTEFCADADGLDKKAFLSVVRELIR